MLRNINLYVIIKIPAEVDGVFQEVKILSTRPSGGTLSPSLSFHAR